MCHYCQLWYAICHVSDTVYIVVKADVTAFDYMADVIAIFLYHIIAYRADVKPNINLCITKGWWYCLRWLCWQMLLPCCHVYCNTRYVNYSGRADVIAQWKMVNPLCESIMCGRCYCPVEDGKSTMWEHYVWQMLLPGGDWNTPGWRLADVTAKWQMEWPLYYFNFSSGVSNRTSSHNMWQMVFTHISVEGWIICSYVHGFFYCSLKVLVLFPHYGEIFQFDIVTSGGIMVKNWGWGLVVFFEPFSEISRRLTNVLFITLHPVTCIFIYDTTSF